MTPPPTAPIAALIATADRPGALATCLETLWRQSLRIQEIIVVDASRGDDTERLCTAGTHPSVITYIRSRRRGAATQRMEGLAQASSPFILFLDDDVELDERCVAGLWRAMTEDAGVGGASAMLVNQRYTEPGRLMGVVCRAMAETPAPTLAGRCLGPVVTFWPADDDDLPEIVPVEWLNTTCTMYRRDVLPAPLFPDRFVSYSLGEDVCLSLTVGKSKRLVNARTARAVHHSRPDPDKPSGAAFARMSLVNRHYIMTRVLGRRSLKHYVQLAAVEMLGLLAHLPSPGKWRQAPGALAGRAFAVFDIVARR